MYWRHANMNCDQKSSGKLFHLSLFSLKLAGSHENHLYGKVLFFNFFYNCTFVLESKHSSKLWCQRKQNHKFKWILNWPRELPEQFGRSSHCRFSSKSPPPCFWHSSSSRCSESSVMAPSGVVGTHQRSRACKIFPSPHVLEQGPHEFQLFQAEDKIPNASTKMVKTV